MTRRLALVACCLGVFMGTLDATMINVALPRIQRDLGASFAELQWIVDAYHLTFAALLLPAGAIIDRFGRRRMLVGGTAVFAGGSAIAALSTAPEVLIAARALSGAGAAAMVPATLATIVATFEEPEQSRAIGAWAGATALALAAGPLVGGALVGAFDWEAVFWVNVPLGALAAGLAWIAVRADGAALARDPIDGPGIAFSILAIGGALYALIHVQERGAGDASILVAAAVAVAGAVAFALRQRRAPAPLLPGALFRRRGFSVAVGGIFVLAFALDSLFMFIALYYQQVRDFSPLETGLLYLPSTALAVVLAPLAGTLYPRMGARWLSGPGLVVGGLGLALFGGLAVDTPIARLIAAQFALGVGFGITFTPLSSSIVASAPEDDKARASSADNVFEELGSAFGVAALGALVAALAGGRSVAALSEGGSSLASAAPEFAGAVGDVALVAAALCVATGAMLILLLPPPPGRESTSS